VSRSKIQESSSIVSSSEDSDSDTDSNTSSEQEKSHRIKSTRLEGGKSQRVKSTSEDSSTHKDINPNLDKRKDKGKEKDNKGKDHAGDDVVVVIPTSPSDVPTPPSVTVNNPDDVVIPLSGDL